MTAYPAWTPASRPGIIPLHPLSFGTILGRSFAALRHNPKVLLGFALGVQAIAYLVLLAVAGVAGFLAFTRLDTVVPGSADYDQIMAGSMAIVIIVGIVLGLAASALSVVVQAVVVAEVAHAALAERLTVRTLWQQVRPSVWRLIGYTFLLFTAVAVLFVLVGGTVAAIAVVVGPAAIALGILVILAAIPVTLWLSTKLLLVPAAIIIERATIGGAVARSWSLIRGRFWPALGVTLVLSIIFGALAQLVAIPFTLMSSGLGIIIAPTGAPDATAIITLVVTVVLQQAITLLIQAVTTVVQATAASLIYIDCRMRREGLDLDLLSYVEKRDAGQTGLGDPYQLGVGREFARPLSPAPAYGYAGAAYGAPGQPASYGYGTPSGDPGGQYGYAGPAGYSGAQYGYAGQAGYSAAQYGYAGQAGYPGAQFGHAGQTPAQPEPAGPAPQPPAAAPTAPPAAPAGDATWPAPGAGSGDGRDAEWR